MMKSIVYIIWGLAVASLTFAAFTPSMIWVTGFLLILALFSTFLQAGLYRPPEDHLGVIYELGRFSRLVGPDEWVYVIPGLNQIKNPISLEQRRVEVTLSDLLTQDQVPLNSQLLVYYQLDLRWADVQFRSQALQIPEEGWSSIIRTILQETASEVMSGNAFQQLLSSSGRGRFKRALSALLAERVQGLGLMVNPLTGVSVQTLKPAEPIWQAMVDRLAAVTLGEAALARVYPMIEELSQRHPEIAWDTLLLQWAAAMTKDSKIPQVLVAPTRRRQTEAVLQGRDRQQPDGRSEIEQVVPSLNGERETNMAWMNAQVSRAASH